MHKMPPMMHMLAHNVCVHFRECKDWVKSMNQFLHLLLRQQYCWNPTKDYSSYSVEFNLLEK